MMPSSFAVLFGHIIMPTDTPLGKWMLTPFSIHHDADGLKPRLPSQHNPHSTLIEASSLQRATQASE
jgi:hypothetical protein